MGDSKKGHRYKAGEKHCNLCIEKKLDIASYNNPNELLDQRSEIFKFCKHNKVWLRGK